MTDDIVDRLDASYEFLRDPLHLEARDEIERLRTDNEHIERMWLELINNCRTKSAKIMQAHSEIERLRAALNADAQTLRLHLGEMTAQEMRTVRAAFAWVLAEEKTND